MDVGTYTAKNKDAWERVAEERSRGRLGGDELARGVGAFDVGRLPVGDWRGLRVLHLMCASGEDSLTLALAGADVTGVDISDGNVAAAREKAAIAGLDAEFVAADVYDLPDMPPFDVVFTGGGALCWLPDIRRWAGIVAGCLVAGGRLVVQEMHPLRGCFDVAPTEDGAGGGRLVGTGRSYFSRGEPQADEAGAAPLEGGFALTGTAQFRWPVGDVVTALARAGMRIDTLEESFTPPADPAVPARTVALYGLLPNEFLIHATKEPRLPDGGRPR